MSYNQVNLNMRECIDELQRCYIIMLAISESLELEHVNERKLDKTLSEFQDAIRALDQLRGN